MKNFSLKWLMLMAFILGNNSIFADTCQGAFPGAISSTDKSLDILSAEIHGTTDNKLIAPSIKQGVQNDVTCDGVPCQWTGTTAETIDFTVDDKLGNGTTILKNNVTIDGRINSAQEYKKIYGLSGKTVNFYGDLTLRVKDEISYNSNCTINVKYGTVVIYTDVFEFDSSTIINIDSDSRLIIYANTFDFNSGSGNNYNSPNQFIVLTKDKLEMDSGGELKGLFYSAYKLNIRSGGEYTGAFTGADVDFNSNNVITYDAAAVNEYCGGSNISGTIYDENIATPLSNVTVHLYDGNTLKNTQTTDASGLYTFNAADGNYSIVVDSKTIGSYPNVWAQQIASPIGGLCSDGNGGSQAALASAGACYGGKIGNIDDDASSLATAEHIAEVEVSGADVSDMNFGFSFNSVSNTKDEGQGTLRQFITNANFISGANEMKFIPMEIPNSGTWWSISLSSILPNLTDAATTIDGTAYAIDGTTIRDENSGSLSGSIKLGTGADGVTDTGDEPSLLAFDKPELEIVFDSSEQFGFKVFAHDIVIKNLAFYGASGLSGDIYDEDNGNIQIAWDEDTNNIVIENNFIGVRADGSVPASKSSAYGINFYYSNSTNFSIKHNYISSVGKGGIYLTGSSISDGTISQNEVQKVDWFGKKDDGIAIESGVSHVRVYENYVHNNDGPGLESYEGGSDNYWYDNTVHHNGHGTDATEFFGIRLVGTPGMAYQNHIYGNKDAGILIQGTSTSGQRLFKNSIYQNGTIGIDLDVTDDGTDGDGVTSNNGTVNSNKANNDMDYPVFTTANLNGTTLHLEGYVGSTPNQSTFASATIEVYKAQNNSVGNAEGKYYLGTCTNYGNGNFVCDITTSLVVEGDFITAIATDSNNNTSEFGESFIIVYNDRPKTGTCYATTDDNNKLYIYEDLNDQTPLPTPRVITTTQPLFSEGGAYRAVDGHIYQFTDDDDTEASHEDDDGPNSLWKINVETGVVSPVKDKLIDNGDDSHVDAAEFYYDESAKKDTFYVIQKYEAKLHAFDPNDNWSSLFGYPKDVKDASGTTVKIGGLAIDPYSGDAYGVRDYGWYSGSDSENPVLYRLDLSTGVATELFTLPRVDAEGLAYADDGNLYLETEEVGSGDAEHKIYKLNIYDGTLTKVSHSGTNGGGDIETLSCNGGTYQSPPIFSIEQKEITVLEGNPSSTDIDNELNGVAINITIKSNRPIRAGEDITIEATTVNDTATLELLDFIAFNTTEYQMAVGADTLNISQVLVQADFWAEKDEVFSCEFSVKDNKGSFKNEENSVTITIDDDDSNTIDAWAESNADISDRVLRTKVVGKPFNILFTKISAADRVLALDTNFGDDNNTKYRVIDASECESAYDLNTFTDFTFTQNPIAQELTITTPIKEAKVQFYWEDQNGTAKIACSTDAFAVRPDKFTLTLPTQAIKAGEAFILDIKAVDLAGNPVNGYNEVMNTSFDINYTEQNIDCSSNATIDLSGISFSDGVISTDINYSEVGMLDFNISEIAGSEFALIDANDTLDDEIRLITKAISADIEFIPGYFEISNLTLKNGAQNFTYYAKLEDIAQMGAELNTTIRARNTAGALVKNYSKECHAKDTNFTVTYNNDSISGQTNILEWADKIEGFTHNGTSNGSSFTFDINKTRFVDGATQPIIYINFGRDQKVAKEPLRLTITNLNATDTMANGNNDTQDISIDNKSADFYYGRMHTPNYYGIGEEHNITVFHEVYAKDADKSKFIYANAKESEDSINWYILKYAQYSDGGRFTDFDSKNNDDFIDRTTNYGQIISGTSNVFEIDNVDSIKLEIPKAPFRDRITYKPDTWLIYNRFNATKDTHSFNINISSSSGWAGKGKEGLTTRGVTSIRNSQKMDW